MSSSSRFPEIVTRSELLAAGHDPAEVTSLVRSGELHVVRRGIYSPLPPVDRAAAPGRWAERNHADRIAIKAAARRSPHLVVSHVSAAVWHGMPLVGMRPEAVHLTRIAETGAERTVDRVVHARRLPADDIVEIDGVQVTSPARTLVDLGRWAKYPTTAVVAADWSLHTELVTPDAVLGGLASTGRQRGVARARRLLRLADGRAESPGESVTRLRLADQGLGRPELQITVRSEDCEFLGRSDLGYPEDGLLIEFDGAVKYRELLLPGQDPSTVVTAEKRREDRLREHGYVILRVVWADLNDPGTLAARVRAAQQQGRRAVAAGMVRGHVELLPPLSIVR